MMKNNTKVSASTRTLVSIKIVLLIVCCFHSAIACAQSTPHTLLLVLNKRDNSLAIIDPATLSVLGRAPAGQDPHEVVASSDGKLAFISNYGGGGSNLNTLSVVDLTKQKAMPAVNLGPLHSPHGLWAGSAKIYFTAEANKIIGRYDPAAKQIDWLLGLGQDRTHMVVVSKDEKKMFTSNVNSDTISIIEHSARGNGPPPPGGPFDPQRNGPPPEGTNSGPPPDERPGAGGPPPRGPGGPPPFAGNDWSVTSIQVGGGPEGFDLSPDEKEIWAANSHDGTISIIDVAAKKVTQTLNAQINFANRLKFTPDGKRVLVSSLGGGDLVVFDTLKRQEIKRLKVGRGAAGILMEPGGARAYVACSPDDKVVVIDLKTLEVTGQIASGREPDGLAWVIRK